jgi:hypothetical protein
MAIQKCVRILLRAMADGVSTQFTVDLAADPYYVGETTSTGSGGDITNWEPTLVTGVTLVSGALGASIALTVVTVDVAVANDGTVYEVVLEATLA